VTKLGNFEEENSLDLLPRKIVLVLGVARVATVATGIFRCATKLGNFGKEFWFCAWHAWHRGLVDSRLLNIFFF
jgi:hypothetical protein